MAFTTAELFAARGDEWNRPNFQHHAAKEDFVRRVQPDGTVVLRDRRDIDGYDEPTCGPRAAIRKREIPSEPRRVLDPSARLRANALIRSRKNMAKLARKPEVIRVR